MGGSGVSNSRQPMGPRALVEGAFLAAIAALLAVSSYYLIPYISLFLPTPIAILVYRRGMTAGGLAALVAAVLAAILGGNPVISILVISAGGIGLALGELLRQGRSSSTAVVVASAVGTVMSGLVALATLYLFGVNPVTNTVQMFQESWKAAASLYERAGVPKEQLQAVGSFLAHWIPLLFPAGLVAAAAVSALANFWLVRVVMRRLGNSLPGLPPFATWRIPAAAAWIWVAVAAAGMFVRWGGAALAAVASASYLLSLAFLMQGLAVSWQFLARYEVPPWLRVALLLFLATAPFSLLILLGLGLMDTWLDFRSRWRNGSKPSPGTGSGPGTGAR